MYILFISMQRLALTLPSALTTLLRRHSHQRWTPGLGREGKVRIRTGRQARL